MPVGAVHTDQLKSGGHCLSDGVFRKSPPVIARSGANWGFQKQAHPLEKSVPGGW
jgi:hypothetical protein